MWILVGTSSITIVSYAVLSFVTENDLILFERLYSLYVEAVTNMTSNDPRLAAFENILVGSDESTPPPIFPPNSWIALEMAKASGAFLGMISAKVVLASLLWLIFEMKFQPAMPVQEMIEDDDDEVRKLTDQPVVHLSGWTR